MNEKKMTTANGNTVYCIGSQERPILVLGGGPGLSSRLYRKSLEPLGADLGFVFWDYGSVGASKKRSHHSFVNDYRDMLDVIKTADLKKFSVLAHSYGGSLALKLATDNVPAIENLILVSTSSHLLPVFSGLGGRKKNVLSEAEFQSMGEILERLQGGIFHQQDGRRFCALEAKCQLLHPTVEQIEKFVIDSELNIEVLGKNQDWIPMDFTSQLASIKAKTLVVVSDKDIIVPKRYSQSLIQKIPKVQVVEFDRSGHWPFAEESEKFSKILKEFCL